MEARHLRFWLTAFSDEEIALMATEMLSVNVPPEAITAKRQILTASGALDESE